MLTEIITDYLVLFPDESEGLALLQKQVAGGEVLNNRKNFRGHITAGGIVLSPDKTKLLLVHHKIFDRWFQPAGHWDEEDANPLVAAKREVVEETAVQLKDYLPVDTTHPLVPLDINSHYIPGNPLKKEAEHYHHDFRYVFIAQREELAFEVKEVHAAVWAAFDDPRIEAGLRGVVAKLRKFKLI